MDIGDSSCMDMLGDNSQEIVEEDCPPSPSPVADSSFKAKYRASIQPAIEAIEKQFTRITWSERHVVVHKHTEEEKVIDNFSLGGSLLPVPYTFCVPPMCS